jgi:hypothetical protein
MKDHFFLARFSKESPSPVNFDQCINEAWSKLLAFEQNQAQNQSLTRGLQAPKC